MHAKKNNFVKKEDRRDAAQKRAAALSGSGSIRKSGTANSIQSPSKSDVERGKKSVSRSAK